jgi:hypothetical protein
MISTETITIDTDNGKREILTSPVLLQSKEPPVTKFGKIVKLHFYDNWIDDEYQQNIKQEPVADEFKTADHLINFGQFYLGSLDVNFETRTVLEWQGEPGKMNDIEVELLKKSFFNPDSVSRRIVIFTPTRPADFNHGNLKYLF